MKRAWRALCLVTILAATGSLAACTQDPDILTRGDRAYGEQLANRPAYQRLYRPIFPSEDTPRLFVLGDFDTPRSYNGESWRHMGLDIVGRRGDRVIAVVPGEACVDRDQIHGRVVYLFPRLQERNGPGEDIAFVLDGKDRKGEPGPHRLRVRIAYAHLRRAIGDFGQCRRVEMGEPLGEIGVSGIASDPHLHFEVVVEEPSKLPGEPALRGAINPLFVMRRAADAPIGTVTCYEEGMDYQPNPGAPANSLTIVWPTESC